jgi:DNA repair exonuclease SbcCD ATPase subunit
MKIISLEAENIKKLVAVEIRPDGNLVQITGKNGQGKTSVLDSIWWALSGQANIQGNPIRKGENKARIKLDLGEVIVTRTFKKTDEGNTTSTITVENSEGTAIRQPQTMLDRLIGELSFDPLAFARMLKREQFEQLKRFVPEVDFEAIEKAHQEDYDKRTNINRQAHEAKILAKEIFVTMPENTQPIDESALVDELEAAGNKNAKIEKQKSDIRMYELAAKNQREEAAGIRKQIEELTARANRLETHANNCDKILSEMPEPSNPIDVSPIKTRIMEARKINEQVSLLARRSEHIATAEKYEADSEVITQRINVRQEEKRSKIAAAKLPVPGIGFGDGEILLNGVPFNQASDAEQLQISIAMAMALNPKLRVIRVRDGSLLDEDSLKLLDKMATDKDYQVWIESVSSSNKIGIVLVDGHVAYVNGEKLNKSGVLNKGDK